MLKTVFKYFSVFVVTVGFFITVLLVQATLLALISKFTYPLIAVALLLSLALSVVFFLKIRKNSIFIPRITLPSLLITSLVLLLLIYFPHDTFGGRDEAGYANYAVYLAEQGTLTFPTHLNNLNDKYVEHIQSTLPVYTSWLALNKLLFGAQWMLRSNSVLIGLGLMSFFMVASLIGGSRIGLLASALYASSMPFLWFSRETMTENLSFFLLWYLLFMLFTYIKIKRLVYIIALFIGGWLFALTRIEGLVIQFILFGILFFVLFKKRLLTFRHVLFLGYLYLFVLCSAVFVIMKLSLALYVLPTVNDVQNNMTNFVRLGSITSLPKSSLYRNISIFTLSMLQKYNYGLVIFSIFIAAIYIILRRKHFGETKARYITILLVLSPEFLKLVNPGVTLDQPWLYRRFMYALLPFGYISLVLLIDSLVLKNRRWVLLIVFCFLFAINLYLSKDILFLKNNWLLVDKLEKISELSSSKDLIIIKNGTLNYYSPTSFLTLQKGIRTVVYSTLKYSDFIPKDKIYNSVKYDKLYLLSSFKEDGIPEFKTIEVASIPIEYAQLEISCRLYLLGRQLKLYDVYNYSRISYNEAVKYCSGVGFTVRHNLETLYLYELK